MNIRHERPEDATGIREVHLSAFETSDEADLVSVLRDAARPLISLVAEKAGTIVGHILFTPVTFVNGPSLPMMGLAPMAVLPEWQRRGIGSRLVLDGLQQCRQAGTAAVVVVGHPAYYPRFGFVPASRFGISCEYDVPDDAFLARELRDGALVGITGTVRYHPSFAAFEM